MCEDLTPGEIENIIALPGDDLLDSIFSVVTHVLRARRCSLMVIDEEDHLVVLKSKGLEPDVVASTRLALGERIAGRVAATRKALLITYFDPPFPQAPLGRYETHSFISVPVLLRDKLFGVLNTADKMGAEGFDAFDLRTLTLLAQHVAVCIESAARHRHVARLANTDELTGLYNYRYFQERLDEELERGRRFGRSVALLMTDFDSFKELNDRYGHPAGDLMLQEVASVLRNTVRQSDIVSRYGGDEFAIIAPETDEKTAQVLARRLSASIARHPFQTPGEQPASLSLSIGISAFPNVAKDKTSLIEQADRAMYAAKQSHQAIGVWQEQPARLAEQSD